ncbi:hypothetical protein C8F04DRAFT_1263359 [Mycena alexandri]|uniref:Uncharacterized protein n=1 Tax=Mycena alexandri TaxID=1745969 RepID=A0AAD6X028_9AGAR|nr:hypothetical protein C8F04DRAFT_1263359 [Mycena alexandri]
MPEHLEPDTGDSDNGVPDSSTTSTDSWDTFAQALGTAFEQYLAHLGTRSSIPDDLIPVGPARSWGDPSWQVGPTDGEAAERDWAYAGLLTSSTRSWDGSRRAPQGVPTIEIVADAATDAEADAIEGRSELLNNLFWDPLNMPAHFREAVQLQMVRMEPRRRSRVVNALKIPRKVHLFDEELQQEGTHGEVARACPVGAEPGSGTRDERMELV